MALERRGGGILGFQKNVVMVWWLWLWWWGGGQVTRPNNGILSPTLSLGEAVQAG